MTPVSDWAFERKIVFEICRRVVFSPGFRLQFLLFHQMIHGMFSSNLGKVILGAEFIITCAGGEKIGSSIEFKEENRLQTAKNNLRKCCTYLQKK